MNKFQKLLKLLVAPIFILAICSSCSDDDETVYIYDVDDLLDLQERVNDGEYDLNGVLMRDIDMAGIEWEPIGYSSWYPFCATFNGNGYTISNLTMSTASSYQGLIGVAYEATIKNVKLKDPQITGGVYVGALCGYITEDCTITNCSVEGGSVEGYSVVGGLVGEAYYTEFSNCWSATTVTATAEHVGGIVGIASASPFDNCYNAGDINGSGNYIGGLAGSSADSEVTGCFNSGDITGSATSNHVGGITGNSIYYITACYNTGDVTGNEFIGGIAGSSMALYTSYMDSPAIIACYNSGDITGSQYYAGIVGRALASTTTEICYFVDPTATQVGAWIDDGTGIYTTSDQGMTTISSITQLNQEVPTINTQIETYIYSTDTDIPYRYLAGGDFSPSLYKY